MKYFLSAIAAIFFFSSCEREIDISSVNLKDRLVVNALLNDFDAVSIAVSHTTIISDSFKPSPIENAIVTIEDQNANVNACTYNALSGRYESSFVPKSGETYKILVKAANYPTAFASVFIPAPASSQKSTWKDSTGVDSAQFPTGTITAVINDNGSEKNYYRITIFYWVTLSSEWRSLGPELLDAAIANSAFKTEDGGIIFDDKIFNGTKRTLEFITPFGFSNQSPKFLVKVENLSKEYYNYFKSIENYKNSGGVFSEPTAIYTNITNGVGIAAGSSKKEDIIQ